MKPVIGRFNWEGCEGCKHSSAVSGGCDVPPDTLELHLAIDMARGTIACGMKETAE